MFAPIRSIYALRPHAPVAVLMASAGVTAMFTATPFLIPELADRYGVSPGRVGLISVAQVGAFAVATMVAGRRLPIGGASLRLAVVALIAVDLASAVAPTFTVLIVLRAAAGAAGGAVTALVWADAMREQSRMAGVAVAGPATALVGALFLGLVADTIGPAWIFVVLAVVCLPAAILHAELTGLDGERSRPSRSRSNRVLLLGLFTLTTAGASLFVFEAVVARSMGVAAGVIAVGYSSNAAGGLIGARLASRVHRPGVWLAATAVGAVVTVVPGGPIAFLIGMTWWGFAFWMGLPGVLALLSARSLEPGERAGDAQGWMAFGRAAGPLGGGLFIDASAHVALALTAASGLMAAGTIVSGVQWGRGRWSTDQDGGVSQSWTS
jgi:predicted MFS family arabinose efflux permease